MTKLYSHLTLSVLSQNDYLKYQALTDLCTEINPRLNNSIFANHSRKKEEEIKQEEKICETYDFLEIEKDNTQVETDKFNDEK